jgi:zinc/manganese transport system substrate-binding protein
MELFMTRWIACTVLMVALGVGRDARADLMVVATTADLAAVAGAVGGEHVDVVALALPTQDPHFVDARPHLALDLARADLLVAIGLDLEIGWLPTLRLGSRNPEIQSGASGFLDCSTLIDKLEVPTEKVDRSMGDVHPGGNPHYMFDPRRVARIAAGIAARMSAIDPENAEHYRRRAEVFQKELETARSRWEQAARGLRGQPVIAYHKSLSYLADWLGMNVVENLEPKPGIPPNPRHVAHVLATARARGVKLIIQEVWHPRSTGEMLAERAGARLVVIPGGPDFNKGESYVAFINKVIAALAPKAGAK